MKIKTFLSFFSGKGYLELLKKSASLFGAAPAHTIVKAKKILETARNVQSIAEMVKIPAISDPCHVLLGDCSVLHERISGRKDFDSVVAYICGRAGRRGDVEIGLSRYNFFKIKQIYKFCMGLLNGEAAQFDILEEPFKFFPIRDLSKELSIAVKRLNKLHPAIKIGLYDQELPEVLETAEMSARLYPFREDDLARSLGVVFEEAFAGPQVIVVDPFHRCNVKCAHCFVHNPVIHHSEEFLSRKMDLQKFKEIIDDAAELKTDCVILQGDGEPLLHPDFLKMIEYVGSKGIKPLFFTNGSLLNRRIAKKIIEAGVREIYCSLPAGTAETYDRVCLGGRSDTLFQKTVENMKMLAKLKKNAQLQFPRITMTHVLHSMNFHELIQMAETDAYIGSDAARFYMIRIDDNNKHLQLNEAQLGVMKKDLPRAEEVFKRAGVDFISNIKFQFEHYEKETGAWSKDVFLKEGCTIGWYFCLVPALGDLSMCCHLRTVGYLKNARLKDIWRSDYFRQKRIEAKFMSANTHVSCLNGVKLYDEHCDHCDNHQNLINAVKDLKDFGLYKFSALKG